MKRVCFGMIYDPDDANAECVEHVFRYHNSTLLSVADKIGKSYRIEFSREYSKPVIFYTQLVDNNYRPELGALASVVAHYNSNRRTILSRNSFGGAVLGYVCSPPSNVISAAKDSARLGVLLRSLREMWLITKGSFDFAGNNIERQQIALRLKDIDYSRRRYRGCPSFLNAVPEFLQDKVRFAENRWSEKVDNGEYFDTYYNLYMCDILKTLYGRERRSWDQHITERKARYPQHCYNVVEWVKLIGVKCGVSRDGEDIVRCAEIRSECAA